MRLSTRIQKGMTLVGLALAACASLFSAEGPVDVLVQGAEKLEIKELREALQDAREVRIGNFVYYTGRIGSHRVALSLTGQAIINCTYATIVGIETFHPKLIVNQGTSGAQAPFLQVHDIIVGSRAVDYGNYSMPSLPAGSGSKPLGWLSLPQGLRAADGSWKTYPTGFLGDPEMIEVALRTRNPMGRVYAGVIGSAHEVNLELDRVKWTRDRFGMDVEEMESAHVAALAEAFGVRYVAFRVVSDAPYDGVDFIAEAARATAVFSVNFLKNLPPLP